MKQNQCMQSHKFHLELIESSGIDIGLAVTQLMASAMSQAIQTFMFHGGDPLGYRWNFKRP